MKINQNLTTINYSTGSSTSRIKYIVIHYTANNGDTAKGNTNYFKSTYRGASAHYFVDEDSVWQSVLDKNVAWHCGTSGTYYHAKCRNNNSIGVELCSEMDSKGNYYFNDETVAMAVELVKSLMDKYNVPVANVIRHYDVTHKLCPAPYVNNTAAWKNFLAQLTKTEEVDDEVVEKINLNVNGTTHTVNRILKDSKNYICLSDLAEAGFTIGYDANTKVPSISNTVKSINVSVNGNPTTLNSINIAGYNYTQIRDLCSAVGNVDVGYANGVVTLDTK